MRLIRTKASVQRGGRFLGHGSGDPGMGSRTTRSKGMNTTCAYCGVGCGIRLSREGMTGSCRG